jgi:hypothetical protein
MTVAYHDAERDVEGVAAPRVFHYSIDNYLPLIIDSGEIRTAVARVPRRVRPVVWCSLEPEWEPTANKSVMQDGQLYRGGMVRTARFGGGLARIEVDPTATPYTWADYKRKSGESAAGIKRLSLAARDQGADPKFWRISFERIPASLWVVVEFFSEGAWTLYRPGRGDGGVARLPPR